MENFEINAALNTLGYLIHILPSLIYYESTEEFSKAYETVVKYIQTYQNRIEDDWK